MADEPDTYAQEQAAAQDVPPDPSPGGTVADQYVRAARGRAPGGSARRGRVRPEPPGAPTDPPDEDPTRPLSPAERNLREAVLELYTGAQMLAHMADPLTGELIMANKEACADAWIMLARRDRRVKALLVKLTTGSAWSAVIMAHVPILLPLLMRKGILPGGALFGGAPFNSMPGMGADDGGSVTDDWPYGAAQAFPGTVNFGQNGNGGGNS